eukprot:Clim_evm51s119 gene=Clim_evmTU51s119
MADKEGFLCPECRRDMGTASKLEEHFRAVHLNEENQNPSPRGQTNQNNSIISRIFTTAAEVFTDEKTGNATRQTEAQISRAHWQRDSPDDICAENGCQTKLSGGIGGNRRMHCRRCGLAFCLDHCSYEMKLAFDATPDSIGGKWHKVCARCFFDRDEFRDTVGRVRNRTDDFSLFRDRVTKKQDLDTNKIVTRLDKLLYPPPAMLNNPTQQERRKFEQSIVKWKEPTAAKPINCVTCTKPIRFLMDRKSHCRLCGNATCYDTDCSEEVNGLATLHRVQGLQEGRRSGRSSYSGPVRVCQGCHRLLKRAEVKQGSAPHKDKLTMECRKYKLLRDRIMALLDQMAALVKKGLQGTDLNALVQEIQKLKAEITRNIQTLDNVSKKIELLPPPGVPVGSSPQQIQQLWPYHPLRRKFQANVRTAATIFIQDVLRKLQECMHALQPDKMRQGPDSTTLDVSTGVDANSRDGSSEKLSANGYNRATDKTAVGSLGASEQEQVLLEQRRNLEGYLETAREKGNTQEIQILNENIKLIDAEIKSVRRSRFSMRVPHSVDRS